MHPYCGSAAWIGFAARNLSRLFWEPLRNFANLHSFRILRIRQIKGGRNGFIQPRMVGQMLSMAANLSRCFQPYTNGTRRQTRMTSKLKGPVRFQKTVEND
jgi:hypothetical protein